MRFLLAVVLGLGATAALAQAPSSPSKSPKDVVEKIFQFETNGGRLTTDGWYKASRIFVRMYPVAPPIKIVHVVRNGANDKVEETARTENWAEVSVSTSLLGEIDAALRFKPVPKQGAYGVLLLQSTQVTFHVVLTEKQWRVNRDGGRDYEVTSSPQWLIDCDQSDIWINRETAIRYVTDMRDKTGDPAIKRNAEETLATFKRYR